MTTTPNLIEQLDHAERLCIRCRAEGLGLGAFHLLTRCFKYGDQRIGDLATELDVAPASISQIVNRLTPRGLVSRIYPKQDGRVVRVHIEELGKLALINILTPA